MKVRSQERRRKSLEGRFLMKSLRKKWVLSTHKAQPMKIIIEPTNWSISSPNKLKATHNKSDSLKNRINIPKSHHQWGLSQKVQRRRATILANNKWKKWKILLSNKKDSVRHYYRSNKKVKWWILMKTIKRKEDVNVKLVKIVTEHYNN